MSARKQASAESEESLSSQASVRATSILKSPTKDVRTTTKKNSHSSSSSSSADANNTESDDRSSLDVNSISLTEQEEKEKSRPPSGLVHGHLLQSGWVCNYDSDNDQYEFKLIGEVEDLKSKLGAGITTRDEAIEAKSPTTDHVVQTSHRATLNDLFECKYGYHFPSSPTPSMLSELAKQVQKGPAPPAKMKTFGYGKSKLTMLSDEEEQAKRLREMFPTAPGQVVDQMIRIYQGREGCIKAALISLGYKRAADYGAQQATAQSPIMLMMSKPSSKKLFEKLVSYFPDKDETLIKNLMYQHKEVEHEIISLLVESGGILTDSQKSRLEHGTRKKLKDKNGAIMKLRYLKFLFPTCEEIELYHLLHCNDLNAQKVIEQVEKRGHKKANIDQVMQTRKTQTQQMKAQQAALAARDKVPVSNPLELHRNRTKPTITEARATTLKENIKKSSEENSNLDDNLILGALEATDYNESLAKRFLLEMTPIDEAKFKQRYIIERESGPSVVLYPCKGIQKGATSFMSITANEYVAIPREIIDCKTALALLKVDACTFTQDDFPSIKFTHAKGKNKDNLTLGSIYKTLEVKESLRRGANFTLPFGSQYEQICVNNKQRPKPNNQAKGRNEALAHGRRAELNYGHNSKLIQRTHPFFQEAKRIF